MKADRRSQQPADLSAFSLPLVAGVPLYRGNVEEDVAIVCRRHLAEEITGGLSFPSRMPCPAWGLSASRCNNGSKLAEVPGSTCESCYATKGRYGLDNVQDKLERCYEGLFNPLWTPAMVFLIRWHADQHFRWFHSGDLVNDTHLLNICTVARNTPDVRHWLPTREYETVRACRDALPENLLVRVSATMVDGAPPSWWPNTSTVISGKELGEGICGAKEMDGHCGTCRDCWDSEVLNIAYRLH